MRCAVDDFEGEMVGIIVGHAKVRLLGWLWVKLKVTRLGLSWAKP
jgi:hypothetical protein